MLAMQVNHSSLLPSFAPGAALRRFLLARLCLSSPSRARPENLPLSSFPILSPFPPGPPFHSVHSLLRRDGRREGDTRCIAYQAAFSSLSPPISALHGRLFSLVIFSRSNFAFSGRASRHIRKRKDEGEFRAKERGDEQGRE